MRSYSAVDSEDFKFGIPAAMALMLLEVLAG
jgi:hypothetical protein